MTNHKKLKCFLFCCKFITTNKSKSKSKMFSLSNIAIVNHETGSNKYDWKRFNIMHYPFHYSHLIDLVPVDDYSYLPDLVPVNDHIDLPDLDPVVTLLTMLLWMIIATFLTLFLLCPY